MKSVTRRRMGDAYLLLDVAPGASDEVADVLAKLQPSAVPYAAAVWGPWDVVARVNMKSLSGLLEFIDQLRIKTGKILRSETWLIRHDQPQQEHPGRPDRLAFVMLRIDPRPGTLTDVLKYVCNRSTSSEGAQVWHVAGVLGPYDIATTVSYDDDIALKNLVMKHFQGQPGIRDTLTIPSIAGMVYPRKRNMAESDRLSHDGRA